MGKSLFILTVSVLALNALALRAQDQPKEPAAAPKLKAFASVIGEVTAIDPGAKQLTLKTSSGAPATVLLDEKTLYLKVAPGEKDLKKAAKIALSDVAVGDRVAARVRNSTDQNAPNAQNAQPATPAVSVMVMTKAELAQHHERNREEWVRRGVAGKVDAIDPAAKQITVKIQTPAGLKDVTVGPVENVNFRRYAPDSVRFADATPSTFADLKVGDNLRVLGDKSEDGTHIKPEEIVSGTFRNIAGSVLSVDAAAGQLKITDLSNKKPLTITVNADTTVKKLPPEMAARMARMRQGGGPGGPAAGGPPGIPAGGPGGGPGGAPGGPGMRPRGNTDFQAMLERVPAIALTDLKPGDALIISTTAGTDPSRVTAITLMAGVEPLLTAPGGRSDVAMSSVLSFDIGMPPQ
ncbi:MAG: hypothetical protein M3Z23_03645 [Acidobacteriota bacterium]|nr:hypothetical protein [Acidobacteriota bacterium]